MALRARGLPVSGVLHRRSRCWPGGRLAVARMAVCLGVIFGAWLVVVEPARAQAPARDLEQLLDGVESLLKVGVPGPLSLQGRDVFPLALGASGEKLQPLVAALRHGRGRVIAWGHGGYLGKAAVGHPGTRRLLSNGLRWLGRDRAPIRVGLLESAALGPVVEELGYVPVAMDGSDPAALANLQVVVCQSTAFQDEKQQAVVRKFIKRGGGLLIAGLGWGWQQLHPGQRLAEDFPGNQLLGPLGLVWTDGYLDEPSVTLLQKSPARHVQFNARWALERLITAADDIDEDEQRQLSVTLLAAVQSLPVTDEVLLPRLRKLVAAARVRPQPSAAKPLKQESLLERLALVLSHRDQSSAAPGEVSAAATAVEFPGVVSKSARRVTQQVDVDLSRGGWVSTGLYAPAGEVVTVQLAKTALELDLTLRIGVHKDTLWHKDAWKRHPEICVRRPLRQLETKVASAHGGLILIEAPKAVEGVVETVRLGGVVPAPRFVLGVTSPKAWRKKLRDLPGPWAELETAKVILTVPSGRIRDLDDPEALLEAWDRVLDCYAELGMRPLPNRPERMVTDVQISAGYMHSGYPIMTHLDAGEWMVDVDKILGRPKASVWGLWHELGHNHQRREWTFAGTGEVTCNLFTLFVLDRISGVAPIENPKLQRIREKAREHIEAGAPFETWKQRPFLALWMYVELQDQFGWQAFQEVFAQYRDLPRDQRPRQDSEKRDQWLLRFSRVVERDLGPFFQRWGVPTSAAVRESLADLEPWLPE